MHQLIGINVFIITMDLGLLGLECASLYILETTTKPVFYSIKLKLEFAVLSRLVSFVRGGSPGSARQRSYQHSVTCPGSEKMCSGGLGDGGEADISDFVDLTRITTDHTHAYHHTRPRSTRNGASDLDFDLARLEHVETLPSQNGAPNGIVALLG